MKLKLFTFRFSDSDSGFDDAPMQEFIRDKEVIEFSEHFFFHEKTPYLTVIVSYRHMDQADKRRLNRAQDPRKDLDEREKAAYDALRVWRAERARQEGIPPFMIANNRQLAQMTRMDARTKSALAEIKGIGEARAVKYGDEILKILGSHMKPAAATSATREEASP